ncbi:hypothetical protein [Pedobacter cryophilus]|uniref:Uncharacterized protein n=1 Tax=Pedobacter cryophilus TaxID=2571271 RepID=A0A4U1BWX2_9SPHI|nr:hypothetical protein [Pedobacter cryophilus]TKB96844.1 hypothetical protein FA046_12255 [Pedobacter cryophilus]
MATEIKKISERTVEARDENGNILLYTQVYKNLGGIPVSDADVDGIVYIKFDYAFYKKNDVAEAVVPDPTFTDDTFDI